MDLSLLSDIFSIIIGTISIYIAYMVRKSTAKSPHIKIDYHDFNWTITNNGDKNLYQTSIKIDKIYMDNDIYNILPEFDPCDAATIDWLRNYCSYIYDIGTISINQTININNVILGKNMEKIEVTQQNFLNIKKQIDDNYDFINTENSYEYLHPLEYSKYMERKITKKEKEKEREEIIFESNQYILSRIVELHLLIIGEKVNEKVIYKKL